MKDRQILLLSIFASFALLGLLFTQFYWLRDVLSLQKEQYANQMYPILKSIDDEYEDDLELKYDIDMILLRPESEQAQDFLLELSALVKQKLDQIEYEYEFALVSLDHITFRHFSDANKGELILREGIRKKMGVGLQPSWKENLADGGKHHFYLYLYFPNQQQFLYQNIQPILLSAFCSLLLIAIFAYTIYTIVRQKKLGAMKNDFINHLTHEFKTPIASIALATKTLHKIGLIQKHSRATNYINLIAEESTRLENHIDKVLQLSLLDSNNFELDKSIVDVHWLIRRVVSSLALVMQAAKGQYQLNFSAADATILADKMHLFNVLYNLIDNAIKYTNGVPNIQIETQHLADNLVVRIKDNGIGMSEAEQALIFGRFYRSKKQAVLQNSGFGLGLSYVKQVMDAHESQIKVESEQGVGTMFELIFSKISTPTKNYA
ncbi:MAG: HAMP domain-containing sensor histidine kinase [Bacteroidota bacterium]